MRLLNSTADAWGWVTELDPADHAVTACVQQDDVYSCNLLLICLKEQILPPLAFNWPSSSDLFFQYSMKGRPWQLTHSL